MHISTSISTAEWAAAGAASAAKEHGAVRRLSNMLQALQGGGDMVTLEDAEKERRKRRFAKGWQHYLLEKRPPIRLAKNADTRQAAMRIAGLTWTSTSPLAQTCEEESRAARALWAERRRFRDAKLREAEARQTAHKVHARRTSDMEVRARGRQAAKARFLSDLCSVATRALEFPSDSSPRFAPDFTHADLAPREGQPPPHMPPHRHSEKRIRANHKPPATVGKSKRKRNERTSSRQRPGP